jgi:hypothetical protein
MSHSRESTQPLKNTQLPPLPGPGTEPNRQRTQTQISGMDAFNDQLLDDEDDAGIDIIVPQTADSYGTMMEADNVLSILFISANDG